LRFFLCREISGKCFEDSANHLLLAIGFALAGFDERLEVRRQVADGEAIETAAHGAQRLRQIMNDAMQQDFFFLNFAQELFVIEHGIARGLQPLRLFREGRRGITDEQNLFSVEAQSGCFERRLDAIHAAFDPIAGIRGAAGLGIPELFSVQEEILEKGRALREDNGFGADSFIAPDLFEPAWERANRTERTFSKIFEQSEALRREERFENGVCFHGRRDN